MAQSMPQSNSKSTPSVWWIDDNGQWLNYQDTINPRYDDHGLCDTSSDYGPYFSHLGLIKVIDYGSIIDVHWDVHNVEQKAINGLLEHLTLVTFADKRTCYLALKFYFGAWNTELYNTLDEGLVRIHDIIEFADHHPNQSTTKKSVAYNDDTVLKPLLNQAIAAWDHQNGILDENDLNPFSELLSYSITYRKHHIDGQLVQTSVGKNSLTALLMGDQWRFENANTSLNENYIDREYSSVVCADYLPVLQSNNFQLDHIQAYIHPNNQDPVWNTYERLLLPWEMLSGDKLLMCISAENQQISLPFLESAISMPTN
jgi:hypothetical protein